MLVTPGICGAAHPVLRPGDPPIALRFSALDPAARPIDEQWLLKSWPRHCRRGAAGQFKSAGEATVELSGLRTRLDQEQSRIVFEYVHVARNKMGDEWGETLTIPVSYQIERGQ